MRHRAALLTSLILLGAGPTAAEETPPVPRKVTITRIRGATTTAVALKGITDGAFVLERDDASVSVPLDDTIAVAFATAPDAPRDHGPDEVELHLWSGERLFGRVTGGNAEGVVLEAPLLGKVEIALDHIEGLHFRKRLSEVVEPPEFTPSEGGEFPDTVHMVGGDRIRCAVDRLGRDALVCATAANDEVTIVYERLTALRLGKVAETPKLPAGVILDVVLRDGTRTTGSEPTVADGRIGLASVSGFRATAEIGNVVAIHVRSDAFRYLSDHGLPAVEVKPFWKPVAGDARKLYAPRMDRAWSGGPLRCGGRTWLKGIGVFAGTSLTWKLDGSFAEFRTSAGLDDAAGRLGGVVFEVWVDGKRVWDSGFVRGAGAEGRGRKGVQESGRIPVHGATELTLKVLPGDAEDPYPIQDQADWLGAMLVRPPQSK